MRIEISKARREELRWNILEALYAAQPTGTAESVILNAIRPVFPDLTLMEIRNELDYLAQRDLVTVADKERPVWFAKINRHGIDIVEYTVDCHPGIARPREW